MSRPRPRYSWPAGAKAHLRAARDHAAALTGLGAAAAAPGTARRLRAAVRGPHGGRPTRCPASDAVRFGFAIVMAAGSSPVADHQRPGAVGQRLVRRAIAASHG
jgi:hypothetical protein